MVGRRPLVWIALAVVCLVPSVCLAQPTPVFVPPFASPGPVGAPAMPMQVPKYPNSLIPTLTLGEEYNDNIFFDNHNRKSDWISSVTPGVTLFFESAVYRFVLSGNVSSIWYADHSSLDSATGRANVIANGYYRLSPRATISLSETYTKSENTNITSFEGIATGLRSSQTNTFTPAFSYDITPLTTVRVIGTYALSRYSGSTTSNADVYRGEVDVDHRFSPRLTGTAGYQFAYFDLQAQSPVSVHTPKIGGTYLINPTLTVSANGGPQFIEVKGNTTVGPFANARVTQAFSFGSATASYDHSQTTAGGLAGTSETDTLAAGLFVTQWIRDLSLGVAPRFTHARLGTATGTSTGQTITAFNVGLSAGYQILSWMAVIAQYNFFNQRENGTGAVDVDQNRVFLGLQFGVPINLEPILPSR